MGTLCKAQGEGAGSARARAAGPPRMRGGGEGRGQAGLVVLPPGQRPRRFPSDNEAATAAAATGTAAPAASPAAVASLRQPGGPGLPQQAVGSAGRDPQQPAHHLEPGRPPPPTSYPPACGGAPAVTLRFVRRASGSAGVSACPWGGRKIRARPHGLSSGRAGPGRAELSCSAEAGSPQPLPCFLIVE